MGKSKSSQELKAELIPFLTDLAAKAKGIRPFDTQGPAGDEPVGGLRGTAGYIANKMAEENGLKLQEGEINPFVFSQAEAGGKPGKQMYEYWASDTMPTLPKDMRKQYDVVFAGTRPFDPSEEVYNTKFGYNLADKTENVWKFVPRQVEVKPEKQRPVIAQAPAAVEEADRPVSLGTISYSDPNKFLGEYMRSIGTPVLG